MRLHLILEFCLLRSTDAKVQYVAGAHLPLNQGPEVGQMEHREHDAGEEPPKGWGPLGGMRSCPAQFSVPNS